MKRSISFIFGVALVLLGALTVSAEEIVATDISADTKYTATGYSNSSFLKDKDIYYYLTSNGNATVTLENQNGIASLYLLFDLEYWDYQVTDNTTGKSVTAGSNGFIHEYIDLEEAFGTAPTSVTLNFANGAVSLSEIYAFSSGEVPAFVQKWEPPLEGKADILMLPTHGDDDHLYFAGLLPYYAGELDCAVQVAYLTNHRNDTNIRFHEILNGLWKTGVENYPVFAFKWDFRVDDLKESYRLFTNFGVSDDDLMNFIVGQLRRFKPQVVVGHDVDGEYGHGMHQVYADILIRGVAVSNDPEAYPTSAQEYGVWDVPKTYLHLWPENPIVIDYDVPLERFDGLTAFQVTQKYGFPSHASQHIYDAFIEWLYGEHGEITNATQIKTYNPAYFGLYRSTVGEDVAKNDLLENITTYAEQERLEQIRLEQERLEQERLEQERLEQERLEQERLEQQRQEQQQTEPTHATMSDEEFEQFMEEALVQNEANNRYNRFYLIAAIVIMLVAFEFGAAFFKKRHKQSSGQGRRIPKKPQNRKK